MVINKPLFSDVWTFIFRTYSLICSILKLNELLNFCCMCIFNNFTSTKCSVITAYGRYRLPGGCSQR
jgi:hypothetical protein